MGDRYWINVATGSSWNDAPSLELQNLANKPLKPSPYQILKVELHNLLRENKRGTAYGRIDNFLRRKAQETRLSSLWRIIDDAQGNEDADVKALLEQYLRENF